MEIKLSISTLGKYAAKKKKNKYMFISRNYFSLLSVIYNLESCEKAPRKLEPGNSKRCVLDNA